ncbi:MAG TPA: hypothetical protein DCF44_07815 [Chitinophagaceae bacterium]|nr:hypothetical protein [Chitinophagaceae bacterium]
MMIKWIIIGLLCMGLKNLQAQKLATGLIHLSDSTAAQFKDINELYFLHQASYHTLQKLVRKLSMTCSQQKANAIIEQIAKQRTQVSAVVLSLDYYFKREPPMAGSNVEHVLALLSESPAYHLVNQYWFSNSIDKNLPTADYKKKIQDTLRMVYNYGAFYYLSKEDSAYIARMKKVNVDDMDVEIEDLIEQYLGEQTSPFRYDVKALVKDIEQVKYVVATQHDGCVAKTMQLPNWDQIGVVFVKGKDTVERVYTIQYGMFKMIRLGKRIWFPLKSKPDIMFYKGVGYGLHFIQKTRALCEQSTIRHEENMKKTE